MSRIGKKPVFLPAGVTAEIANDKVTVKGPKGALTLALHAHAHVAQSADSTGMAQLDVTVNDPENDDRAIWGTMRALLNKMVKGVTEGYAKTLELNGVGFKMNLKGKGLLMSLGFSHDVEYELPEGVVAKIEGNVLTLSGIDAEAVGRAAAEIRSLKKPEPYKGKGFKYSDEVIRRKAGKAAKSEK
ncbi:MAG: 50S ribosomal protein L6 [Patescibacteria group bacterium]|jgi:large subunit ribosomal protein L6